MLRRPRPRTASIVLALAVAAAGLLGGCATEGSPVNTADPRPPLPTPTKPLPPEISPTVAPPATPTPGDGAGSFTPEEALLLPEVIAAVADEAERAGVQPDAVEVVSFAHVTWPDSSIGCPQPGMMYAQALVPGSQLVLRANGQEAHYHGGETGELAYCADPGPALPAETGDR